MTDQDKGTFEGEDVNKKLVSLVADFLKYSKKANIQLRKYQKFTKI